MTCPVCKTPSELFGRARVLARYQAEYRRCPACGFIHVVDPVWLEEAYATPINSCDLGLVSRNLWFARQVKAVVELLCDRRGPFIDYGGGTGLLTRLLRDAGYDFFWHDRHCQNLFAAGFVAKVDAEARYQLMTALEVVEHLVDPMAVFAEMLRLTDNLLFTTQLLPDPAPALDAWDYYAPRHGQHLAFFSRRALAACARRLGVHYVTNGRQLHLLSRRRVSPAVFRIVTSPPVVALAGCLRRRSLLESDHRLCMQSDADRSE